MIDYVMENKNFPLLNLIFENEAHELSNISGKNEVFIHTDVLRYGIRTLHDNDFKLKTIKYFI
jgi:hypothetical protein